MKNNIKSFFKDVPLGLLIGFIIGLLGTFLTFFIKGFVEKVISDLIFATGIMALGTIILACASFWTIRQNYKFREKDRKERLLNEIIDWLRVLEKRLFPNQHKIGTEIYEEAKKKQEMNISSTAKAIMDSVDEDMPQINVLNEIIKDCKYIGKIAFRLDEILCKLTIELEEQLISRRQLIFDTSDIRTNVRIERAKFLEKAMNAVKEGKDLSEYFKSSQEISDKTIGKFTENASKIRNLIEKAIEQAINIKVNL